MIVLDSTTSEEIARVLKRHTNPKDIPQNWLFVWKDDKGAFRALGNIEPDSPELCELINSVICDSKFTTIFEENGKQYGIYDK